MLLSFVSLETPKVWLNIRLSFARAKAARNQRAGAKVGVTIRQQKNYMATANSSHYHSKYILFSQPPILEGQENWVLEASIFNYE